MSLKYAEQKTYEYIVEHYLEILEADSAAGGYEGTDWPQKLYASRMGKKYEPGALEDENDTETDLSLEKRIKQSPNRHIDVLLAYLFPGWITLPVLEGRNAQGIGNYYAGGFPFFGPKYWHRIENETSDDGTKLKDQDRLKLIVGKDGISRVIFRNWYQKIQADAKNDNEESQDSSDDETSTSSDTKPSNSDNYYKDHFLGQDYVQATLCVYIAENIGKAEFDRDVFDEQLAYSKVCYGLERWPAAVKALIDIVMPHSIEIAYKLCLECCTTRFDRQPIKEQRPVVEHFLRVFKNKYEKQTDDFVQCCSKERVNMLSEMISLLQQFAIPQHMEVTSSGLIKIGCLNGWFSALLADALDVDRPVMIPRVLYLFMDESLVDFDSKTSIYKYTPESDRIAHEFWGDAYAKFKGAVQNANLHDFDSRTLELFRSAKEFLSDGRDNRESLNC